MGTRGSKSGLRPRSKVKRGPRSKDPFSLSPSSLTSLLPLIRQARLPALVHEPMQALGKFLQVVLWSPALADARFCYRQERDQEKPPTNGRPGSWGEARTTAPLVQEQPAQAWRARARLGRAGCAWGRALHHLTQGAHASRRQRTCTPRQTGRRDAQTEREFLPWAPRPRHPENKSHSDAQSGHCLTHPSTHTHTHVHAHVHELGHANTIARDPTQRECICIL